MNTIDYATLSDQELKQYILEHREDGQAFHAYVDRRKSRAHKATIQPGQADLQQQFQEMVQRQIQQ
jgi:hypothetical protein